MPAIRIEHKHCAHCGNRVVFAVQLALDGIAELVTDTKCKAGDRVGKYCEPTRINHAVRQHGSKKRK